MTKTDIIVIIAWAVLALLVLTSGDRYAPPEENPLVAIGGG